MSHTTEEKMLERLDLILRVLALQVATDKSITDGVFLLKTAGLDNKTIAAVLNTTEATVRALTASNRKEKRVRSKR